MEKQKIDRMIDAFRSAMYQEFGVLLLRDLLLVMINP